MISFLSHLEVLLFYTRKELLLLPQVHEKLAESEERSLLPFSDVLLFLYIRGPSEGEREIWEDFHENSSCISCEKRLETSAMLTGYVLHMYVFNYPHTLRY